MALIVNLRLARKRKARVEKEKRAAENRRRYGRSKAARNAGKADEARQARALDGKRLSDDGPETLDEA